MRRLLPTLSLLLLVPGLAACGTETSEPAARTATGTPAAGAPASDGWRTEYWRDLQVDVPADWGFGGAPFRVGGSSVACAPTSMYSASGEPVPDGGAYVGRPLTLTDMCMGDLSGVPRAPYVWLGADVEPGTHDLGGGWVQESVEVNGSLLTVTSDDAALRERILGSATGGETCLSEIEPSSDEPFARTVDGAARDAETLTVCAYRVLGEDGDVAPLVYADVLSRDAVAAYLDATQGAGVEDQCPNADVEEREWVALELGDGEGNVLRRDVVHLVCPGIDLGAADVHGFENVELTPARTAPWSHNGVRAALYYFIGPQG